MMDRLGSDEFDQAINAAEFHHGEYLKYMRILHRTPSSSAAQIKSTLLSGQGQVATTSGARDAAGLRSALNLPAGIPHVYGYLRKESFTSLQLLRHLQSLGNTRFQISTALDSIWDKREELTIEDLFRLEEDDSAVAACGVYEVGDDGTVECLRSENYWGQQRPTWTDSLGSVNRSGRNAVGRITSAIPSPSRCFLPTGLIVPCSTDSSESRRRSCSLRLT